MYLEYTVILYNKQSMGQLLIPKIKLSKYETEAWKLAGNFATMFKCDCIAYLSSNREVT